MIILLARAPGVIVIITCDTGTSTVLTVSYLKVSTVQCI